MNRKFQRKKENFICEKCGTKVIGNGYTNHCPNCLFSKHVDNFPGDRKNNCQGMMEPIAIEKEGKFFFIVHVCQECGFQKRNKVSKNDSQESLAKIMREKTRDFFRE